MTTRGDVSSSAPRSSRWSCYYETDVEPDPEGAVARVLAHIGIDLPPRLET